VQTLSIRILCPLSRGFRGFLITVSLGLSRGHVSNAFSSLYHLNEVLRSPATHYFSYQVSGFLRFHAYLTVIDSICTGQ